MSSLMPGVALSRPRLRALATVALAAVVGVQSALASRAVVPDEFITVQSAIDSGVDTVFIREGTYSERPAVDHPVVLRGIGVAARPRLHGLDISNANFWAIPRVLSVSGIAFFGRVEHATEYYRPRLLEFEFSDCSLEAGFYQILSMDPYDVARLTIRNCLLGGASSARADQVIMEADTIDGGVAWVVQEARIQHCWFRGGSGRAIALSGTPRPGMTAHNQIEGYGTAVYIEDGDRYKVESNTIVRCGTGIESRSGTEVTIANNEIVDCDVGVDMTLGSDLQVRNNRVRRALLAGVMARSASLVVEGNVVGECGGDGIVLDDPGPTIEFDKTLVMGNTIFMNGGSGISVTRSAFVVGVDRNIGFANRRWGLAAAAGSIVELRCNDWFRNGGTVTGVPMDSTDLNVDPLFCNVDSADVRLDSASLLADAPGCGQIGALGVGCGKTATLVQHFTAGRVTGGIRVVWQVAEGATASEIWLERSEAMEGATWMRPLTERSVDNQAVVELDRSAVPDRAYWYRLVALERNEVTVIGPPIVVEGQTRLEFRLVEVGPNPGDGPVRIAFALQYGATIEIDVFDVQGRRVASPGEGMWLPGTHEVVWDGRTRGGEPAPTGVYVVCYAYPGGRDRRAIVRVR